MKTRSEVLNQLARLTREIGSVLGDRGGRDSPWSRESQSRMRLRAVHDELTKLCSELGHPAYGGGD